MAMVHHHAGAMTGSEWRKPVCGNRTDFQEFEIVTLICGRNYGKHCWDIQFSSAGCGGCRVWQIRWWLYAHCNELLEAVMLAGLTQHQLLVFRLSCAKHMALIKTGLGATSNFPSWPGYCRTSVLLQKCSGKAWDFYSERAEYPALIMWSVNGQHYPNRVRKIKFTWKRVNLPESGKKVYPNQVKTFTRIR